MKNLNSLHLILAVMFWISACTPATKLKFDDSVARNLASVATEQKTSSVPAPAGDRQYVASFLEMTFMPTSSSDQTTLKNITQNFVRANSSLGGGCDRYAMSENSAGNGAEFPNETCVGSTAIHSFSNPMRFSYVSQACEEIISTGNWRTWSSQVMKKVYPGFVSGGTVAAPTDITIATAYHLFYPVENPSDELVIALKGVGANASSNEEGWRQIMLTLCISPEWQIF